MSEFIKIDSLSELAYRKNIPLNVIIELLTKCNLKCEHCYIPSHNDIGMNTKVILKLLSDLRKMGTLNITFTGGEIFLRNDIFEIITAARNMHINVSLMSNAFLLDEEKVKELSSLNINDFSVSIYSLDKHIHDSITGVPGSLEKTLDNIMLMKRYNIPIIIKTPVMRKNYSSYKDIQNFCKKNNFKCEIAMVITSRTDGDKSTYDLRISQSQLIEVLKDVEKEEIKRREFNLNKVPCKMIFNGISIDCKGNVYPCNSFLYKIGNIFEKPILDIWSNSEELKKLKQIKNRDLYECINCSLNEFCMRCPGLALSEDNSLYGCSSQDKCLAEARMKILESI